MSSFVTEEGKALSKIIRFKMDEYFRSEKTDFPDIVNCIISTSALASRIENIKAYCAVAEGIKEYAENFSTVTVSAEGFGIAPPFPPGSLTPTITSITEADNILLTGDFKCPATNYYLLYTINNTLNFENPLDSKTILSDTIEKYLNSFVNWMSFPLTVINTEFFSNEKMTYITGNGTFILNEFEKIKDIAIECATECANIDQLSTSAFVDYWDIMGTGITKILNNNTIYSIDGGVNIIKVSPFFSTHMGFSQGKVIFGSKQNIKIKIEIIDLSTILGVFPKINYNFNFELPDLQLPEFSYTGDDGILKKLNIFFNIGNIEGGLDKIFVKISDSIKKAVNDVIKKVFKILKSAGVTLDKISEIITNLFNSVSLILTSFVDSISLKINEFLTTLITDIMKVFIEGSAQTIMSNILVPPITPAIVAINNLADFQSSLDGFKTIIEKFSDKITSSITNLKNVVEKLGSQYEEITPLASSTNQKISSDNNKCNILKQLLNEISDLTVALGKIIEPMDALTLLTNPIIIAFQAFLGTLDAVIGLVDTAKALAESSLLILNNPPGLPPLDPPVTFETLTQVAVDTATTAAEPSIPTFEIPSQPTIEIDTESKLDDLKKDPDNFDLFGINSTKTNLFSFSLEKVLKFEGGYVNDPNDSGGSTNKGVTQKSFDAYNIKNNFQLKDVRQMTDSEIETFYYKEYWKRQKCHLVFPKLSFLMFDTSVNMGSGRATKFLQRCLNTNDDGNFGSGTLKLVNEITDELGFINKYIELRRQFYYNIVEAKPSQQRYINGWINRINEVTGYVDSINEERTNYVMI